MSVTWVGRVVNGRIVVVSMFDPVVRECELAKTLPVEVLQVVARLCERLKPTYGCVCQMIVGVVLIYARGRVAAPADAYMAARHCFGRTALRNAGAEWAC